MTEKRFGTSAAESRAKANKSESDKARVAKEELLTPSHPEAKELIRLALQVKELAPWRWMGETDVFGVEDPETGRAGFVSIMGTLDEYLAIAVYLGSEGLYGWMDLEDALELDPESESAGELFLELPALHVIFSEREFLEKQDKDLLKAAGIKLSGKDPMFRSDRPGYISWFITRAEARFLIHVLSQTLEVATSFEDDPDILPAIEGEDSNDFLVRVPGNVDASLVWEDQIQTITRPLKTPIETSINNDSLRELKRLPQSNNRVEADLIAAPGGVGERGERPRQPYILVVADNESEFILGCQITTAEYGIQTMYETVPEQILQFLLRAKLLPERLTVRSERLAELLQPLSSELKIQLECSPELPAVDAAAEALFEELRME